MIDQPLWSAQEVQQATRGRLSGGEWTAMSVSIDTRSLQPGALFIALKDKRDGHDFVASAFAQGAAAAIVDHVPAGLPLSARLVQVEDTLGALEALARHRRSALTARVAAVTGSAGKTSTKEALLKVLSEQGMTHASAASFNNHWGTPLTMARCPKDAKYVVVEIGMNHSGEIRSLVPIARPHAAIITNVAAVHLEHFPNVDAIADAKAEIFEGLEPGGVAIINADNPYFQRLKAHAMRRTQNIVTFGQSEAADVRLAALRLYPAFSECLAVVRGERVRYRLGVPGAHMALNSAGVLATALAMGADPIQAAASMAGLQPVKGRGTQEIIAAPFGRFTLIDESYNANPASMAAALALLGHARAHSSGRRIAVLGDMLELGLTAAQLHAGLSQIIQSEGIDLVFAAGPLMRHLWDALDSKQRGIYGATAEDLARVLPAEIRADDVVMVKGSNGSRMAKAVEALRRLQAHAAAE